MSFTGAWRLFLPLILGASLLGTPAAVAQKTMIRFTNWMTGPEADVFKRVIEDFEKLHPDIDVEYLPVDWTGETGYLEKLTVWKLGGSLPDVVQISYALLPQLAEQGFVYPIDTLLARDAKSINVNDIVPIGMEAVRWKGKTYGLPYELGLWWMNYNRDAFAEVGLADPLALYAQNGWTWEAMETAARRITKVDANGKVQRWGMWTFPGDAGLYPWLWAFGGDLLNEDGTKARIADPASVAGLSYVHRLMYEDKILTFPDWMGIPQGAPWQQTLTTGNFGMQPWWNTLVSLYDNMGVKWQFDQVPIPPGPVSRNTVPSHIHTIAIMQGSPNTAAAWELVKYITGDGYARIVREMSWGPLRRSLLPTWAEAYGKWGIKGLRHFDDGIARTRLRPRHSRMIEIEKAVGEALAPVWGNQAPVKSTLEQVARRIDQILAEKK